MAICPSECCELFALWDGDDVSGAELEDPVGSTSGQLIGAGLTPGLTGLALGVVDDADRVEIDGVRVSGAFSISAWINPTAARAAKFRTVASQWKRNTEFAGLSAYDAGSTLSGSKGYWGGAFDGRYIYYSPADNGVAFHANILRFDTHQDFESSAGWEGYNAAGTSGINTVGYTGAIFDGRYVYFIPYLLSPGIYHANVLRYDTQGYFSSPSSWIAYDASGTDGLNVKGFVGGTFDGRYIYFSPAHDGVGYHGKVLRFDTRSDFTTATSWAAYDAGSTSSLLTRGFAGAVFDGRYVYFAPLYNGIAYHGFVLRLDPQGDFRAASSWLAYDAGTTGGLSTRGYRGAAFDGRYVYFAPSQDGAASYHGRVLRLDARSDFQTASSWASFDAGFTSGLNTKGYAGVQFDGRYLHFSPHFDGTSHHGRVLRYDATSDFGRAAAGRLWM